MTRTDEAAFTRVFNDLHEQVFALCRHLTGSRVEAEDAVQETFLAVHQALPNFRGESKLSTWVYRIAVNASLGVRARSTRRREAPLDNAQDLVDGAPGPDHSAIASQTITHLERALDALSVEHRAVLSLFAMEGLGHDEIADVLGIPTGTVWSRLHAARKHLRSALRLD